MVKGNVLDDILGDPDDFRDLVDPDEWGSSWEETIRQAEKAKEEDDSNDNQQHKLLCSSSPASSRFASTLGVRFFIVKDMNHEKIPKSVEKGLWAVQAIHENVLNEAFWSTQAVLLIFSGVSSGHFHGYAQMTSPLKLHHPHAWGGAFTVAWIRELDVPFRETNHLSNPLDDFRQVRVSKDCQELSSEVGGQLCDLIDRGYRMNSKRKAADGGPEESHGSKRHRRDSRE